MDVSDEKSEFQDKNGELGRVIYISEEGRGGKGSAEGFMQRIHVGNKP